MPPTTTKAAEIPRGIPMLANQLTTGPNRAAISRATMTDSVMTDRKVNTRNRT